VNNRLAALIVLQLGSAGYLTSEESLISDVAEHFELVRDPESDLVPEDAIKQELYQLERDGVVALRDFDAVLAEHVEFRAGDIDQHVAAHSSRLVFLYGDYTNYSLEEADTLWDVSEALGIDIPDRLVASMGAAGQVPASDRVVQLDHNAPPVVDIADGFAALEAAVRESNELGEMLGDNRATVLYNLGTLRQMWSERSVHLDSFKVFAKSTLRWLATQAGSAVVGAMAMALLAKILNFLG
jgi:hypothetical protein